MLVGLWEGQCPVATGLFAFAPRRHCPRDSGANGAWAGANLRAFLQRDGGPPSEWLGSLAAGHRDQGGNMYMRNRQYDPGTGRFTQEDPIGLAGGLNLYGFAGGDPINFSDPFGLKVTVIGTKLAALIEVLKRSATFGRLFEALDRQPARAVNFTIREVPTRDDVLRFAGGCNYVGCGRGHTIIAPFGSGGVTVVNSELLEGESAAELVVHEFIHAAAGYFREVGETTAIPAACDSHFAGAWSNADCDTFVRQILDELDAARENEKEP